MKGRWVCFATGAAIHVFSVCLNGNAQTQNHQPSETKCDPKSGYVLYWIRRGDHLSGILYRYRLRPLYGQKGWVQKTAQFNQIKNVDLIFPEKKLIIPISCTQNSPQQSQETQLKTPSHPTEEILPGSTITPDPVNEGAQINKQPNERRALIIGGVSYGFLQINSLDLLSVTRAIVTSENAWSFQGNLEYKLLEDLTLLTGLNLQEIKFKLPRIGSLINHQINLSQIYLGVHYNLSSRFALSFSIDSGTRPFVIPINITEAYVDPELQIFNTITFKYHIVNNANISWSTGIGLEYYWDTIVQNYQFTPGYGVLIDLSGRYRILSNTIVQSNFRARNYRQQSPSLQQEATDIHISIGLGQYF
ncbi:MAG: LysM peptidoglycan-binding domain-containing protein [Bdellovibrionaceae bacterium]|nr:LysM peptidoglycan-binding domain-containing protein [Pseudobdellovibrionaceae bacterium]MDW8190674.1 LysM peptidoglycan-binding domain-containing protein [Pseudobdellovibrionaceae bacterium]